MVAALAALVLVVAAGAAVAPAPASAAPIDNGPALVTPASGDSATPFTLDLGRSPSCPGDTATGTYTLQSFLVPAAADLAATLRFDVNGPVPVGTEVRASLFATDAAPFRDVATLDAVAPAVIGAVAPLPAFDLASYGIGVIAAGVYRIGIACTLGPPGATQLVSYWARELTVTATAAGTGGPSRLTWVAGTAPFPPVATAPVVAATGELTVAFTPALSDPPTIGFTATATPVGGGTPISVIGTASPITIAGLVDDQQYEVTVTATNLAGTSAPSNVVTGTPLPAARPPVTALTATPAAGAPGSVDLAWQPPAGPVPLGYEVTVVGPAAPSTPTVLTPDVTTLRVGDLQAGQLYTFSVTPQHLAPVLGTPASVDAAALGPAVVVDPVNPSRPPGALVLTQVCGRHGGLPAEGPQLGFPSGLPLVDGVDNPSAPSLTRTGIGIDGNPSTDPDPRFDQYPYPDDPATGEATPSYPTFCGVELGTATLVRDGDPAFGLGQFFAASGRLDQITVVDTRDADPGWSVVAAASDFTAPGGKTFSGAQLGWTPVVTSFSGSFTDPLGATYTQLVYPGAAAAPNDPTVIPLGGVVSPRTLLYAEPGAGTPSNRTGGRGIAVADARVKLLIPVTALSGTYEATLTITAI